MAKTENITCVCGETVNVISVDRRLLATGCEGCGRVWQKNNETYYTMAGPHREAVREVESSGSDEAVAVDLGEGE